MPVVPPAPATFSTRNCCPSARELVRDDAGGDVGRPAGGERHHDRHRARGIALRLRAANAGERNERDRSKQTSHRRFIPAPLIGVVLFYFDFAFPAGALRLPAFLVWVAEIEEEFAAGLLDPFLMLLEVVALEDEMVDPGLFEPA